LNIKVIQINIKGFVFLVLQNKLILKHFLKQKVKK